jgi:predicted nicotinamide N-methyase
MDEVQSPDDIPFWAEIWDSTYGLAGHLEALTHRMSERPPMLELGCGVGAVGCAAAALGWSVTMTDHRIEALRYARRNLYGNRLIASLVQADWRDFPIRSSLFGLVVGSDILYEPLVHPDLSSIVDSALSSGATVIIADPGRPFATDFMAAREAAGWHVDLGFIAGRQHEIAIYTVCGRR